MRGTSVAFEQLGRSPLIEQLTKQGRVDLLDAARHARRRLVAIAIDGLRAPARERLAGPVPDWLMFTERWSRVEAQ